MANFIVNKITSLGPQEPYEGIEDRAKDYVGRNFVIIVLAQLLNKLADTMASAKIVLPWIMSSVGAPTFLTGLLVPIRESGSLLPQVLIGGQVQQLPRRKRWYAVGVIIQALCIALIAVVSVLATGLMAGVLILGLLIVISLARGLCSLTSKDVLGKTIPAENRGRLIGLSASISGLIGICLGIALFLGYLSADGDYWVLLLIASICWFLTAAAYSRVKEFDGEVDESASPLNQVKDSFELLKNNSTFRRFCIVRAFMMSSSLCAPYFVLIAQRDSDGAAVENLGMFIVVSGIASFISSAIWGRFADRSSRIVLLTASVLTSLLCLAAAILSSRDHDNVAILAVGLYFLLSITHQGVRMGRKTYIVDLADGNERTRFVATSNSVIGVLLLLTGGLGAAAAQFSIVWVLLMFAVMAILALILGWSLPEAQKG